MSNDKPLTDIGTEGLRAELESQWCVETIWSADLENWWVELHRRLTDHYGRTYETVRAALEGR